MRVKSKTTNNFHDRKPKFVELCDISIVQPYASHWRNLGQVSSLLVCKKKGKIPSYFILKDVCENQKAKFRKLCEFSYFTTFFLRLAAYYLVK
jgi:hypothetical protein